MIDTTVIINYFGGYPLSYKDCNVLLYYKNKNNMWSKHYLPLEQSIQRFI